MLFYRDDTFSTADEKFCPICTGETRKSVFWVMLHDVGALIDFAVMELAIAALLFFAVYQLVIHFGMEMPIPLRIGWFSGPQGVVCIFLTIGGIVSHFLLKFHLKLAYCAKGYELIGARYCHKCGNRFLVLVPTTEAEDHPHNGLPQKEEDENDRA